MKVCIIGAGAGGMNASGRIRQLDKNARIDIFSTQSEIGYAPCELPFVLRRSFTNWDDIFYPGNFFEQNRISVHLNTEITDILRDKKCILAGTQSYPYDKLILSLGAQPTIPGIPGLDGQNEFTLTSNIADGKALDAIISTYNSAAVLGAGAIGIEITLALLERGYDPVYLLDVMPHILPASLDEDMTGKIEDLMEKKGVKLILPARIERVTSGLGKKIINLKEQELEVDFMVLATGAEPRTGLAKKAGIKTGETGAIVVNEYLQTSDPDIYAVGDCMENWEVITEGKTRRLMVTTAGITGNVAGTNLVKENSIPYQGTAMTFIIKIFDYQIGSVGFTERVARQKGLDVTCVTSKVPRTRPAYGGKGVYYKFIADRKTQTLVGAQLISEHEVAGMINELAVVLMKRIPLSIFSQLDIPYSPLIGPDPVRTCVAAILAKL